MMNPGDLSARRRLQDSHVTYNLYNTLLSNHLSSMYQDNSIIRDMGVPYHSITNGSDEHLLERNKSLNHLRTIPMPMTNLERSILLQRQLQSQHETLPSILRNTMVGASQNCTESMDLHALQFHQSPSNPSSEESITPVQKKKYE